MIPEIVLVESFIVDLLEAHGTLRGWDLRGPKDAWTLPVQSEGLRGLVSWAVFLGYKIFVDGR